MAQKIFDITMPIYEGMPVYKNRDEKQPRFETTSDFHTGTCRETRVHLDVHTGTHIDAPLHMLSNGLTIDSIPIESLIRGCKVFDLTSVIGGIRKSNLVSLPIESRDFVLFHTKNSLQDSFDPDFVYLAEDGADYLAEIGVSGVGIDALGIERSQEGHPTHKVLFNAGIVIIEGLRLKDVPSGEYFMIATPLRLVGLDAAPARVVLRTESY